MLYPISGTIFGCESKNINPKDECKEMNFTTTDIFSATFGLPTDKIAKINFSEVKSQIDTELIDKQH